MGESVIIKGDAGVENLEESTPNGNTPALTVSANYEHGVLDIDLGDTPMQAIPMTNM